MSKEVHLVTVGKLKDVHLEFWEQTYLKRMTQPQVVIHEVRSQSSNKVEECRYLVQKIQEISKEGPRHLVLLDEKGKQMDSPQFSNWFYQLLEKGKAKIIFVLGGAEGFHTKIRELSQEKVSLSALTFPHKLARIIFLEQLYRAQTIHFGHPYHN